MTTKTKRDVVLDAALKLFYEKGFKATTMRDIASSLNFEVANLYNYIDSKQSILDTLLADVSNEFHSSLENIITSSYSPKHKLRLILSTHIQIIAKKPLQISLMVNEWRSLKEPLLSELVVTRKTYTERISHILEEGIELGQFRPLDIDIATNIILSSLRWLYDKYANPDNQSNPIELEKELSDFVFAAIRKN